MNNVLDLLSTVFTAGNTIIYVALIQVIWVGIYILGWVAALLWSLIDETPIRKTNYIIEVNSKLWGYNISDWGIYTYENKNGSRTDGETPWMFTLILLTLIPIVLSIIVNKPITIVVITISLLLFFIARSIRRTKKLFDKHIKNKDAHK